MWLLDANLDIHLVELLALLALNVKRQRAGDGRRYGTATWLQQR
jgi:hypothetical protein